MTSKIETSSTSEVSYLRFEIIQRIEHIVFLLSFTILGITGLVQKYSQAPISQAIISALGGIEATRYIHHVAAIVMIIVSVFHILSVLYRIIVRKVSWTMMPVIDDFKHLYHDVMYYLGLRKHNAYYGRYTYAEKAEYLAVVWGTVIMVITGFLMWNPVLTTKLLPGQLIPAAKAAHGAEAVLAILAIIIWHMYHVHLRHFNKSIFTGHLTEKEMEEEHPAELAQIKSGEVTVVSPEVIRKRKRIFIPVATVISILVAVGLFLFVTIEATAITTVLPGESAQVFVPVTPTPKPTLVITATPTLAEGISEDSWDGNYSALFKNRCSTCHATTKVGGLSLATYQDALLGGNSGPGIVPGSPNESMVVEIQLQGNHPGQLTDEELQQVINWIEAGAPER